MYQKNNNIILYNVTLINIIDDFLSTDDNGDYILWTDPTDIWAPRTIDCKFIIIDDKLYINRNHNSYFEKYPYRIDNTDDVGYNLLTINTLINAPMGKIIYLGGKAAGGGITCNGYVRVDSIEEADLNNILINSQMGGGKSDILRTSREEVGYAA